MRLTRFITLTLVLFIASLVSAQRVNPSSFSFESVPPNTTPEQNLTFFNTGTTQLTLSFTIPTPFTIADNRCAKGVKPGTHCNLYLTYTAQTVGEQDNGNLVIDYGDGSVSVPLSGAGVQWIATSFWRTWNNHPNIRLGDPVDVYATLTLADPSYYSRGCGGQVVWSCSNGQGGSGSTSAGLSEVGGGLCHGRGFKGHCLKAGGQFVPNQKGQWSCSVTYPGDGVCGPSSSGDSFHVF